MVVLLYSAIKGPIVANGQWPMVARYTSLINQYPIPNCQLIRSRAGEMSDLSDLLSLSACVTSYYQLPATSLQYQYDNIAIPTGYQGSGTITLKLRLRGTLLIIIYTMVDNA
jgi:hypothetical protein